MNGPNSLTLLLRSLSSQQRMSLIKKLLTPSEEYNYRVIFISYCILSALCLCLYLGSLFWSDIKGFWIVVLRHFVFSFVAVSVLDRSSLLWIHVEGPE